MLLALALTSAQINLIVAVAVVFAVLFAANSVLLVLFFRKKKRSQLCTAELQQRREQLLEELHALQMNAYSQGIDERELDDEEAAADEEADDESDEEADDEDDKEGDSDDETVAEVTADAAFSAEILAVRDMSVEMRAKFGFEGEEYDKKRYYVRPSYSFDAKLRRSNYDTRSRYSALANALYGVGGCKLKRSFRQERASIGRKTVALMLFKGKKLCIALALNPADYAESKYRGTDVSDKKRFAATPMLIKLTSERKLGYAVYLIGRLAELNKAEFNADIRGDYDFEQQSRDEMFADGNLKYTVLGEAEDLQEDDEVALSDAEGVRAGILAVNDMSSATRASLGFAGSEYDEKRYFVRYNYSFEARLRLSSDEIKGRYLSLAGELSCYTNLKSKQSFRGVRLSAGRKTVGQIVFKGKTLCLALALNPAVYAESKYRGTDVSDTKRFAATPMLLKLTSERRLSYAKYLLTKVAEENNLIPHFENKEVRADLSEMDINQLFGAGLLKITVIGEAPALKY